MPRFIKVVDLTPEQRKLVLELSGDFTKTAFSNGMVCADKGQVMADFWADNPRLTTITGKETGQPVSADEAAYIFANWAWCFSNDGKYLTTYARHASVRATAADGQNARLQEIEAARKARRLLNTRREVGKL